MCAFSVNPKLLMVSKPKRRNSLKPEIQVRLYLSMSRCEMSNGTRSWTPGHGAHRNLARSSQDWYSQADSLADRAVRDFSTSRLSPRFSAPSRAQLRRARLCALPAHSDSSQDQLDAIESLRVKVDYLLDLTHQTRSEATHSECYFNRLCNQVEDLIDSLEDARDSL